MWILDGHDLADPGLGGPQRDLIREHRVESRSRKDQGEDSVAAETWLLRGARRAAVALAVALLAPRAASAQAIEPRLFSNAPIGLNFLITGFTRSSGGVVLDPTVPLEDASIVTQAPFVGYSRSLGVAGRSAQIQALAQYGWLSGEALIPATGELRTRDVNGLGDPAMRFAVNLHGAPALPPAEFDSYRQDLVIGVSLQVTAPFGQYDPDKLVNLGTNRWSFKPEFGFSKAIGRWILEGTGAAIFYTDNDDFFGGQHLSQEPVYSAQGHAIYIFPRRVWAALDATCYTGGRTSLDGVEGDDLQRNWRAGLTTAFPINRRHSIKVYVSDGVSTRSGGDFVLAGVGWQYRWGRGFS